MSDWIKITDDPATLPEMEIPVVAELVEGHVYFLARGWLADEGWLWGSCYGLFYDRKRGKWQANDCEVDDYYQVVRWHALPTPPEVT